MKSAEKKQLATNPREDRESRGTSYVDVSIANPVIASTRQVFDVMVKVRVIPGHPFLLEKSNSPRINIAATIEMNSENLSGIFAICFPISVFLNTMSSLLGEKLKKVDDEILDGACELLNMISGGARTLLSKSHREKIELTLPNPVVSEQTDMSLLVPQPAIVVPFAYGEGNFYMVIGMQRRPVDEDAGETASSLFSRNRKYV